VKNSRRGIDAVSSAATIVDGGACHIRTILGRENRHREIEPRRHRNAA
jgi:hypothetical protein